MGQTTTTNAATTRHAASTLSEIGRRWRPKALLLAASLALLGCGDTTTPDQGSASEGSTATTDSATDSSAETDATTSVTTGATTGTTDSGESDGTGSASTSESTGPDVCPADEAQVELNNGIGTLYGTVLLPEGCEPHPVVLFHVGSGPTDRDGNGPALRTTNDSLKLLAQALQQRGIASLRYDKRGIAASVDAASPDPSEIRFEDFAEDLVLWIDLIRGDEDRFGALTLLGHSEGALIAKVAASMTAPDRLISLAGAGRPAGDVLRQQLAAQIDGPLLEEAFAIIDSLEKGETVDEVSAPLQSLFPPQLQPYIISWFAYDPAQMLAQTRVPALIAAGTTDIQVSLEDATLLSKARPDAEVCIVEGMNHVLKAATLDPDSQSQAYSDPSLPVVPELVICIADFVLADDG